MNWKLIFSLSVFGLAMGIASVLGFVPANFGWPLLLVIAVVCAAVLAKKVRAKLFFHGFMTGLINGLIIGILETVFSSSYQANNPNYAGQIGQMPGGMYPFFSVLYLAVEYGLVMSLFAWIAGKVFKK